MQQPLQQLYNHRFHIMHCTPSVSLPQLQLQNGKVTRSSNLVQRVPMTVNSNHSCHIKPHISHLTPSL